ncbi:MAG: thiamine biosynthesis protein ThiF [Parcubacteria group bacterium]|nr:thiamine biosynthesis protein ThiF [Parcubacteria group bacterium]
MLDTIRHLEVFSPAVFGDRRIDVVGVGATGSRIALALAKLGISEIHLWDYDRIEPHNVPNQVFGNNHVGEFKVDALQNIIREQTGITVTAHNERVDGSQQLGVAVFLLTDTMASRQEIWKGALRYKTHVKLVVETRMGKNSGRVYAVNPSSPTHVRGWEETLYSDDMAEVSACGTSITVGSTAEVVSGLAVWQLIRWHQNQEELKLGKILTDEVENELVFSLQPMMLTTSNF